MIERALKFFERYGPKILDGFTFEGGYTYIVSSGDGDFITEDTLWDFKVSKLPIKKRTYSPVANVLANGTSFGTPRI